MIFYLLLTIVTLIIFILTFFLWRKTHNLSFPVGIAFIYYWSLYGAWPLVYDQLNDGELSASMGFHYHYLFRKLFQIRLDDMYFVALLYYSIFIVVLIVVLLVGSKPAHPRREQTTQVIVSHIKLLLLSCISLGLSYLIVRNSLSEAIAAGKSGYVMSRTMAREGQILFFSIHQELNRIALFAATLGFVVLLSGNKANYIIGKETGRYITLVIYLSVLSLVYSFCAVLGNKSELFFALIFGLLLFVLNRSSGVRRNTLFAYTKKYWIGLVAFVLLWMIIFIDYVRGLSISGFWSTFEPKHILMSLLSLGSSNEAFGAHFSMYGVLEKDVPLTYGSSIISLIASVVPRAIWPDRPLEIYYHYSNHVNALYGQGYSIHHATGWYLNFGLVGIIFGGIAWGTLWVTLYNHLGIVGRRLYSKVYFIFLCSFTAGIPAMIRTGIDGYKGIAIDCIAIPMVILFLSVKKNKKN